MAYRTILGLLILWIASTFIGAADAAEPRVEIDLVMGERVSPALPQEWMRILSELGFANPQIRNARSDDQIGVTRVEGAARIKYKIVGQLKNDGRIQLTDRDIFARRDRRELRAWLDELKKHGPQGTPETGPFGLTADQLRTVKKDLAREVQRSTKGEAASDTVRRLATSLNHPVRFSTSAKKKLKLADPIGDELQGFSTGTALAAILRSAGLSLRPEVESGRYRYVVKRAIGNESEAWPVGWPYKKKATSAFPRLLKLERMQDVKVPLGLAMEELAGRVEAAVLWDHAELRNANVDLAATEVTMREGKRHLAATLKRLLGQIDFRYQVRVDDAGRTFLWIRPSNSR